MVHANMLVVFLLVRPYKTYVPNTEKFFKNLGERVKKLRKERGHSQEDMISFGFSARHWQQVEAGRPITVTTLLRICCFWQLDSAPPWPSDLAPPTS